jgi:hypothetical protein
VRFLAFLPLAVFENLMDSIDSTIVVEILTREAWQPSAAGYEPQVKSDGQCMKEGPRLVISDRIAQVSHFHLALCVIPAANATTADPLRSVT